MKIIKIFIAYYVVFLSLIWNVFAVDWEKTVKINCVWMPGCLDTDKANPKDGYVWWDSNIWAEYLVNIIETMLQYVSVVAVIALMLSWVLYLFSAWEEEKTKKAKSWIIWSLVWVIVSMSSWFLVNIINNFTFTVPTL